MTKADWVKLLYGAGLRLYAGRLERSEVTVSVTLSEAIEDVAERADMADALRDKLEKSTEDLNAEIERREHAETLANRMQATMASVVRDLRMLVHEPLDPGDPHNPQAFQDGMAAPTRGLQLLDGDLTHVAAWRTAVIVAIRRLEDDTPRDEIGGTPSVSGPWQQLNPRRSRSR